jgi:hypothetical protein
MRDVIGPPAIVRQQADLRLLANQINAAHEAGEQSARRRLEHFRAAGEALLKAKEAVGHGRFLAWLQENVRVKKSRAYQYMRFAKVPVTGNFEDQEAAWRKCSGNDTGQDPTPAPPEPPSDAVAADAEVAGGGKAGTQDCASETVAGADDPTASGDTAAEAPCDPGTPDRLRPIFEAVPKFEKAVRLAVPLANLLAEIEQTQAYRRAVGGTKHTLHSTRVRAAGQIIAALKPVRPCPACGGAEEPSPDNDRCEACAGKGYQTADEFEAAQ